MDDPQEDVPELLVRLRCFDPDVFGSHSLLGCDLLCDVDDPVQAR
ncbi:hypothetical protein OG762_51290 (plasmid) [Streptomyces sp. NBC_01136]|nr:hypothetical protein OG762_51290 [Streptomyces sp. NBC_01136]